jgi:putative aldouronate transport system permease protein
MGNMLRRKSSGECIFDIVNNILLTALVLVTIYPFLYVLFASLSDSDLLMQKVGILLKPLGFSLKAYISVLNNPMIAIGYGNTILYMAVGTTINMLMTSLGAYVLSRKDFRIKRIMSLLIIFTMFFSGGMIPTYLVVMQLGMIDKIWALVLPGAISTMNLLIMRTAFMSISPSLEESAFIDGANDLVILLRIVLPLSLPTVAVMVLFYGVGHWNSWFPAMIYLRTRTKYPLQLILREVLVLNDVSRMDTGVMPGASIGESIKYATIMVATLPILFLYPFLQKYFVKGVMIGAIKE